MSDAECKTANNWIENTLRSRLNDPATGAIVLVMQRLHELDPTGYLLSQEPGTWTHVHIPLEAEETEDASGGRSFCGNRTFSPRILGAYECIRRSWNSLSCGLCSRVSGHHHHRAERAPDGSGGQGRIVRTPHQTLLRSRPPRVDSRGGVHRVSIQFDRHRTTPISQEYLLSVPPRAALYLCATILFLLLFMTLLTLFYENYSHFHYLARNHPESQSGQYKRWKYALVNACGYTGLSLFFVAYLRLALSLL